MNLRHWAHLPAVLLLALLGACNPAPEPGTSAKATATDAPPEITLDELVAQVTAGDSQPVVTAWYQREEPLVEAYSFLEYPVEYGRGRAWYWGDWRTRAEDYCSVRMQYDYTPVQIDCTLGWFAAMTGRTVGDVMEQYADLHERHSGTVQEHTGNMGRRIGEIYEFKLDGATINLFTREELGDGLAVFGIILDTEAVARVFAHNERYPGLKEFGTADQPATLAELVALLSTQRARGMLDHFDFSEFKLHMLYSPPPEWDSSDYREATMFQSGPWSWHSDYLCLLAAYDDGARTQLLFTPGWYAAHCGYPAEQLAADFAALMEQYPHTTVTFDAANDDYDVEFTIACIDEVNVIRRRYTAGQVAGHAQYTLFSGPQMFADAPDRFPDWTAQDLPRAAEPGLLEQFICDLAATPLPVLQTNYLAGFELFDDEVPLHETGPFTTHQVYSLLDYSKMRYDCMYSALNETYLEKFGFAPAWLSRLAGMSEDELAAEFETMLARFDGGPAAGGESERGTQVFDYGPLRVSRRPASADGPRSAWYSVEFPLWP